MATVKLDKDCPSGSAENFSDMVKRFRKVGLSANAKNFEFTVLCVFIDLSAT